MPLKVLLFLAATVVTTASNQSERVATVSCSQSAASLQNNRKQFATKLLTRYSWLWLPTRIGCLRSREYSRSQKKKPSEASWWSIESLNQTNTPITSENLDQALTKTFTIVKTSAQKRYKLMSLRQTTKQTYYEFSTEEGSRFCI